MSGEFIIVNKHLLKDLISLGLWNDAMRQRLMAANGSVQNIEEIPQELKDLYKTTYELSQKVIIDMAADRGAYICQSQSLNLFVENPNFGKLSSMHFYAWQKGLKTGMYYLRSKAAVDPIKFTINEKLVKANSQKETVVSTATVNVNGTVNKNDIANMEPLEGQVCNLDDPDCLMCGS